MLDSLQGTRVLVIEDEIIVAMEVQCLLEDAGCEVVELVHSLDEATQIASATTVDVTLLDINLNGEMTFNLARELAQRGVTVILATGYDSLSLPPELRSLPRVTKPFSAAQLCHTLRQVVGH